jgi:hypothetical protein
MSSLRVPSVTGDRELEGTHCPRTKGEPR